MTQVILAGSVMEEITRLGDWGDEATTVGSEVQLPRARN